MARVRLPVYDDSGNQIKWCRKCDETKAAEMFTKNKYSKDGLYSYCKQCVKQWRDANRLSKLEYNKAYLEKNGPIVNEKRRAKYAEDPSVFLARNRDYYARNSESIIAQKKVYRAENPDKKRESDRAWRAANRDKKMNADLMRGYRITLDEYRSLLDSQGGVCAIRGCGAAPEDDRRLPVDHDHSCCSKGSCGHCVRGVLCTRCNTALGMVNDSQERLQGLLDYLDKWALVKASREEPSK